MKRVLLLTSRKLEADEWKFLHRRLRGCDTEYVLTQIDMDMERLREKTYEMLKRWRREAAVEGATFTALISGLQGINKSILAGEFIITTYMLSSQTL